VKRLENDEGSILYLYRRLIELRCERAPLAVGEYREVLCTGAVLAYERTWRAQRCLVLLNFSHEPVSVLLPDETGEVLLSTHLDREWEHVQDRCSLRADEGLVIAVAPVARATRQRFPQPVPYRTQPCIAFRTAATRSHSRS
jgi:alpha-glucosidase